MAVLAGLGIALRVNGHPWLSVPFWRACGVLHASAVRSRRHVAGHGSAFRTPWMNDALSQLACFLTMRNPHTSRRSHVARVWLAHDAATIALAL